MKINIVYLLLIALLGITVSASIAQQNQNVPKTDTEVEALKNRVSELEGKLQTVENVEKMELAAKLAEAKAKHDKAHAKLIDTDIDKLKGELRESNNDWLRAWNNWFLGIVSVIAVIIGAAIWLVLKTLIEKGIEKRLDGFKESVDKVSILEDQIKILEKEHAASVLEIWNDARLSSLELHPEQIKALTEEVLLDVFNDKTRDLEIRFAAIEVLAARKSSLLVIPVLNFLNSVVDSDIDWGTSSEPDRYSRQFLTRLSKIHDEETYQGIKNFLNRLITENPKNKDLFLSWTAHSLARVSIELDMKDSIDMLREVIPDLIELKPEEVVLTTLAKYFDKFQEHEGIKEILTNGLTDNLLDVEKQCLELLEKYDPDFVRKWKAQKEDTNTESEES